MDVPELIIHHFYCCSVESVVEWLWMVETHKQFISIILDSASPTQNSVIKQEERIPERQKTTLVGIKVKIKQTHVMW